jgi:DNA-binding response OmpR family regulator
LQATHTEARAILLIEDDPVISELLVEYLSGEGYAVTTAADGVAALDALDARSFALIVTDALAEQRPPAERWTQLETIRRAACGLPIIICTAHSPDAYVDYAARGFDALLTKPFDLEDLLALIVHTIDTDAR